MAEKLYPLDIRLERMNAALLADKLHENRWRKVVSILLIALAVSMASLAVYFNQHYKIIVIQRDHIHG